MFGFQPYNYPKFTRELLLHDLAKSKVLGGPRPGSFAPDFTGRTLDGDKVRLSDLRGEKNVVLTFGSATCPMTIGSIAGMNELFAEHEGYDVAFLFVYVREAHPGNDLPQHVTIDDKIAAAELLRDEEDVEMPIIVDEVRGAIHRKYGKLPNPSFLIDKSGRIAFRCQWTQPAVIEEALSELLAAQAEHGWEGAIVAGGENTTMPVKHSFLYSRRALGRGGDQAVDDFLAATGWPGRIALNTSRVAGPVIEHPLLYVGGALAAAGVVVGGVYAGLALRKYRLRNRTPYEIPHRPPRSSGEGDYEAVGI